MNRREMIGKTAASAVISATAIPFQDSMAAGQVTRDLSDRSLSRQIRISWLPLKNAF